ncbi:molybdopterin-guanine dinucleotide biosynthesis protein B [Syntrophobotulus glycolicus DSM 8271]|uniref:Molybdopterin-guanine dinucleotide biosynthesis protein B n=1 Tax=Syntrophobotulus glycolicus (strain DSM 8271 / FlGlyR) TaxID=645991 RepID=F0T0H1_SYNGF|nr:molybdopterin-guanine dinucleotide biosynthesis protein B [Syntrophobotulus glycolicus]ADY57343.1 molybdopterin-guanine dinucleotide biosynthesis protein B [Syntrophobotulus glycolicus DSM 8271]
MDNIPVVCIVSKNSGTGKTVFLEKLIAQFCGRGYRVGTVKSDTHGFEMDIPGKDTWRFTKAGAKAVGIIGPDKYALIQQTDSKKDLDQLTEMIEDVDIILVEGYKKSAKPKVEIVRKAKGTEIVSAEKDLLAVVTDVRELSVSVPVFALEDCVQVADMLIEKFLK